MRTEEKKLKDYLDNELRMRYSQESILPFDDNKAIHKFFKNNPSSSEAKTYRIMNDNITRMSYTLVKNVEATTNGVPISMGNPITQYLLDELNLRPTNEDFQKIKDKDLKLCIVGYGGAMVNVLYNMFNWAMELGETKVFEKIVIFENDNLDFSNIARMGKPIVFDYHPDFIKKYEKDVPNIKTLKKINMATHEKELSKERKLILFANWLGEKEASFMAKKDYIFVGAPTLDTRNMLSDKNFFFLGHSDYEVDITYAPENISSLAVETYGSIDIPVLLINLQLATAAFIKILAGDMDHFINGQRLLDFDMKKWVDENPKKLKELYNV